MEIYQMKEAGRDFMPEYALTGTVENLINKEMLAKWDIIKNFYH